MIHGKIFSQLGIASALLSEGETRAERGVYSRRLGHLGHIRERI